MNGGRGRPTASTTIFIAPSSPPCAGPPVACVREREADPLDGSRVRPEQGLPQRRRIGLTQVGHRKRALEPYERRWLAGEAKGEGVGARLHESRQVVARERA